MTNYLSQLDSLYFIVFCLFIGVEVIKNVPAILHTPLMSGTNAISGIITVGAIMTLLKVNPNDYINLSLGAIAVFLGAVNIAGGFFVTHRMLSMFNNKN